MSQLRINPPAGISMPETIRVGDSFQSLDTWRLEKDGKLCLVEVDGQSVQSADDKRSYAEAVSEDS